MESLFEDVTKKEKSLNTSKIQARIWIALHQKYASVFDILLNVDIQINEWSATPDVAVFPIQPTDFQHDVIKLDIAPLCAIEILSPTQILDDLIEKSEGYFLKGAKSYWLVMPRLENIYVFEQPYNYTIFRKNDILKDENLGIELDLKLIFK
jgi:Uma2 family endonuclease